MLAIEPRRGVQAACFKLGPLIIATIAFRKPLQIIAQSFIEAFAHLLSSIRGTFGDLLVQCKSNDRGLTLKIPEFMVPFSLHETCCGFESEISGEKRHKFRRYCPQWPRVKKCWVKSSSTGRTATGGRHSEIYFLLYIFRRYYPPTSSNALVICPGMPTRTASINWFQWDARKQISRAYGRTRFAG